MRIFLFCAIARSIFKNAPFVVYLLAYGHRLEGHLQSVPVGLPPRELEIWVMEEGQ